MTIHTVKFKTISPSSVSALDAFVIELRDKTSNSVIETFTELSAAGSTEAGVNYIPGPVGGLPNVTIDTALIARDLRVTFVSFETTAGLELVGDHFDATQDGAAGELDAQATGCITNGAVLQMQGRNVFGGTGGQYSSTSLTALNAEGRIFGHGQQLGGYGSLGAQHQSYPTSGRDLNYWGGRSFTTAEHNIFFANIEHHLPGVRFKQIEAAHVNIRFLALTTDGRMYGWGGANNEADRAWIGPAGAGPSDASFGLTPLEIVSPTGDPWEEFYSKNVGTSQHMVFALAGGIWCAWGEAGVKDLAGLGITNTGNVIDQTGGLTLELTPTPVAYPLPPQTGLRHGPFAAGFIQVTRQWMICSDGQIRWFGSSVGTASDEYGSLSTGINYDGLVYTLNGEPNNEAIQLATCGTFSAALGASGKAYILAASNQNAPFAGGSGFTGSNVTTFQPMSDGVKPAGVSIVEIVTDSGGWIMGLGDDGVPYVAGRNSTGWEVMDNEPDLVGVTSLVYDGLDTMVFNTANGAFVRTIQSVDPSAQAASHGTTRIGRLATTPTWTASDLPDTATRVC